MDIAVIQRGSDSSLRFSFGVRSWSVTTAYVSTGDTTVPVMDISGFQVGDQVAAGNFVNPEEVDISKLTIDMSNVSNDPRASQMYIKEIDVIKSELVLLYPTTMPIEQDRLIIKVSFKPSDIKTYDGIFQLAQYVEKAILTTQGSDRTDLAFGSQFFSLLTMGNTPDDYAILNTKLRSMVTNMEAYIKSVQDQSRPATELLKSLIVESVELDYNIRRWKINITIVNQANQTATRSV